MAAIPPITINETTFPGCYEYENLLNFLADQITSISKQSWASIIEDHQLLTVREFSKDSKRYCFYLPHLPAKIDIKRQSLWWPSFGSTLPSFTMLAQYPYINGYRWTLINRECFTDRVFEYLQIEFLNQFTFGYCCLSKNTILLSAEDGTFTAKIQLLPNMKKIDLYTRGLKIDQSKLITLVDKSLSYCGSITTVSMICPKCLFTAQFDDAIRAVNKLEAYDLYDFPILPVTEKREPAFCRCCAHKVSLPELHCGVASVNHPISYTIPADLSNHTFNSYKDDLSDETKTDYSIYVCTGLQSLQRESLMLTYILRWISNFNFTSDYQRKCDTTGDWAIYKTVGTKEAENRKKTALQSSRVFVVLIDANNLNHSSSPMCYLECQQKIKMIQSSQTDEKKQGTILPFFVNGSHPQMYHKNPTQALLSAFNHPEAQQSNWEESCPAIVKFCLMALGWKHDIPSEETIAQMQRYYCHRYGQGQQPCQNFNPFKEMLEHAKVMPFTHQNVDYLRYLDLIRHYIVDPATLNIERDSVTKNNNGVVYKGKTLHVSEYAFLAPQNNPIDHVPAAKFTNVLVKRLYLQYLPEHNDFRRSVIFYDLAIKLIKEIYFTLVCSLDQHIEIISIQGCLIDGNGLLMPVYQHISGSSIHKVIIEQKYAKSNKIGDIVIKIRLIRDALRGMAHVHQKNVVHGNINTNNLLLDTDNRVCLSDFGMARYADSIETIPPVHPCYRAPEALTNPGEHKQPGDMFMLGCVMYEIFTGEQMFSHLNSSNLQTILNERWKLVIAEKEVATIYDHFYSFKKC